MDISEVRNDTQDRHMTFNVFTFFFCHQHDTAIHTCKDTPSVNICNENHIRLRIHRHRHIHQVDFTEIHFRDTTCPFHDDRSISCGKTVKGCMYLSAQLLPTLLTEITAC